MPTEADLRAIALSLPGAYEQPSYNHLPSWRTKPRAFAHVKEAGVAVLHVADEGEKLALIEQQPDVFFTTDHYNGYAAVLVRLDAVDATELREMIVESWRLRAPRRDVRTYDEGAHR